MANFSQLKVISGRILQYHGETPALCSSQCVMSVCFKSQLLCNIKKEWTTKNATTSHRQQIPFRYSYVIFMVWLGKTKLANIALKSFQSRVPTLAFIICRPWTLSTEVFLRSDKQREVSPWNFSPAVWRRGEDIWKAWGKIWNQMPNIITCE